VALLQKQAIAILSIGLWKSSRWPVSQIRSVPLLTLR
jgi:hypothetical protein